MQCMGIHKNILNTGELQRSALPILILQAIHIATGNGRSWMSDIRRHLEDRLVDLCEQKLDSPIDPISVHFATVSMFLQEMEKNQLIETKGKSVSLTNSGRKHLREWQITFKQFARDI